MRRYQRLISRLLQLERLSALATANPEVPNVKIAKPSEFFDSIAAKTRYGQDLATWHGELYFELHRGVGRPLKTVLPRWLSFLALC